MQAKLPDVNGRINYNMTMLHSHRLAGNHDYALDFLLSANANLPEDYRITIDDQQYYDMTRAEISYQCKFCPATVPRRAMQILDYEHATYSQYPSLATQHDKVWYCPGCKQLTPVTDDFKIITKSFSSQPYFIHVIPSPPLHIGMDREYAKNMRKWFRIAIPEIEERIAAYRTDYRSQEEDEYEEDD